MNLNMLHTALVLRDCVCLASPAMCSLLPGTLSGSLAEGRRASVLDTLTSVLRTPVNIGFCYL